MPLFDQISATLTGVADDRPPVVLLHGLTYDRRQWGPLTRELDTLDPGRRTFALDLPGHGQSPPRGSYRSDEVVDALHRAVTAAGLDAPVVAGHSLGGILATVYAARYPTRGVLNLDQPLRLGRFGAIVRDAEPALRGPGWRAVWDRFVAGMGIDGLAADARVLARDGSSPRPELLLGYWDEILRSPDALVDEQRERELAAIAARGLRYVLVTSTEPAVRLPDVEPVVLPGGGHFPHLAHPRAVAELLAQSLQRVGPPGAGW
ncbi:alpha/beta fold hydrolase [Cryptosporangium japonicum]|uniref:Alpha/beta fold hydrolase n=1 Tax=Cryptosporangium japonicum TaxID=80872 RepID=A0ABP3DRX4_9ACTN